MRSSLLPTKSAVLVLGMWMLSAAVGMLSSVATADLHELPPQLQAIVEGGCSLDGTCHRASPTHKQNQPQQNNTHREGVLKQAPKGGEADDDDDNEDALLQLLTDKMVPDAKSCGVYLAPSTIPGAGLGMFAGRAYKPHEVVTQGDIVIPLSELDWHNGFNLDFFLWEEYTWSASSFPHMTEENGYQSGMQGASPGIGAAINCDLPLVNVVDTWSKIGGGGMHRKQDPGAGAITPYHDRKSRATRNIQAGEELYIDYGENYFESRSYIYGQMPMHRNYREANGFVEEYQQFREKAFADVPEHIVDEMEKDLWEVITNWGFETRMLNALPQKHSEIDEVMQMGGTEWRNYKRSIRGVDWLEEHGQCMDNIKPGKSTIAQAGRGVFATRFIPEGGLVSPAPLIHIKDKQELVMYDVLPAGKDGLVRRNASRPIHHQIMLNYAFGHPNSTLLFSPYGLLTSLINHSPDNANTRMVWASTMRNPEWKDMHPDEWVMESHSGLQWDFIALRPIEANEEILIDYGPIWDAGWKEHVESWEKPPMADDYMAAYELQKDLDGDLPTEYYEKGIGEHIQLYCHEHYRLLSGLYESDDSYHRCRPAFRWKTPEGETRYLVELYYIDDDDYQTSIVVSEVLFDVPRSVFHFEDTAYSRDHQMPFSFRHEMMIPDDMFPKAWMNKDASA